MEYILGPVLVLLQNWALFVFANAFLTTTYKTRNIWVELNLFLVTINITTSMIGADTHAFYNYIAIIVSIAAVCSAFSGNFIYKSFITFLFNLFSLIVEVFITYALSVFGLTITIIRNSYILFTVISITVKTYQLIIAMMLRTFMIDKKKTTASSLKAIQMIIYPATCYMFLYMYCNYMLKTNSTDLKTIIYPVFMLGSTVALMSIISKLDEENETKQQNALLNQQLKMGMENIEALNSAYSQQRKLTHDFNNHLSVIRSLLKNGDNMQATEYTDKLLNSSIAVTRLFDSGNSIVDTLLTQKYTQAKDLGIKMQVLVEDLSGVSMSADKLAVVLSNLLDNAIEACTNTNGEKMIKVKFVLEDMGHILTVQNTADSVSNTEKGQFATTKADSLNHGYGIKNISSIMEDYGYPYTFDYKNGWFTFTAMMVE